MIKSDVKEELELWADSEERYYRNLQRENGEAWFEYYRSLARSHQSLAEECEQKAKMSLSKLEELEGD